VAKNPGVDLASYLRGKGSPFADHVPALVDAANRYRVDPRLIVAISGGETSFGKAGRGPAVHNAWGIGPGRSYGSWEESFDAVAKLLRTGYLDKGLTSIQKIQQKWAPVGVTNDPSNLNSNWIRLNGSFYSDLGGNPNNVTLGWRKQAAPSRMQPTRMPSLATPPDSFSDVGVQQALSNLQSIARGESPERSLEQLLQATIQQTQVAALAAKVPETVPTKEQQASPDGGSYKNTPTTEAAANPKKMQAVRLAMNQIGKPYVFGTQGPKSFDCSGLIEWAYEQAGIPTPGRLTTYSAAKLGHSVRGGPMEPGDWIITNGGEHMVMYIGGGEVIAAPHTGTNVQVQKLSDHQKGIVDVRRYP
jgi:cell wall-associated NlpC family hydrolase